MPGSIEYLNINESNALLKTIDDTRDFAIVTLFLNAGLFLGEIIDLKVNSIDWDKHIIHVLGNRKRDIALDEQACEAIARWSKDRADVKNNAFFITTKGKVKELSDRAVDKLIRKYADQAGIKRKVNASAPQIPGHIDTRPALAKAISRIFPTKPKVTKPVAGIKGPIISSPEEVIFGRDSVIEDIKANLNKNQPVLLIGPLGIGKTHLLKHIAKIMGPNVLYISSSSPLKNMLTQICDKLDLTQNLSISDYEMLETRILGLSNRLPLAIVDMAHQLSHQPIVTREAIREVYHEAGIHYRDWTYAIVVLWAIAIMPRFVALGTHSFEAYILAGFGVAIISVVRFVAFRMR